MVPGTENLLPDSARILAWYELVQQVYDAREQLSKSEGALKALLDRAAVCLGLEQLEYVRGPLSARPPPGQLFVPLSGVGMVSEDDTEGPELGVTRSAACQHYLCVRLGPEAARDPAPRAQLERFGRHLARAMQIDAQLGRERQLLDALYATLDAQPLPIVLVDFQGRVHFKNRAALGVHARHPELQLDLRAPDSARSKSQPLELLFQRLRQNLQRGECGMIQHCGKALMLTLIPLLSSSASVVFAPEGPSFALVVQERTSTRGTNATRAARPPHAPAGLSRRLQDRFGLTPSEARLCYGLYAGLSVASYAALADRSALTLRKQLKAIYRKLDVHDQKALILRIWQEQQADWLQCVTLVRASASDGEAPTLLYPAARTEARSSHELARAQRLLAGGADVHG